ncbi:uncharacterized protein [Heterodontus francisci]|uniref:uncharacterized protein n=1 Tax=Heterodontus francisci TaxID=7792 RepID=UPI00355C6CB6
MRSAATLNTFSALFTCFCLNFQGAQMKILVSQSPSYLNVRLGENVTATCSFNASGNITDAFLEWVKGNATLCTRSINNSKHYNSDGADGRFSIRVNWESQHSTLHIRSIQLGDNGTYYCHLQVERPTPIKHGKGNGTILMIVTPDERSPDLYRNLYWPLPALLVPGILLCVLCIICLLVKGSRLTVFRAESQEAGREAEDYALPSDKFLRVNRCQAANEEAMWSGMVLYNEITVPVERLAPAQPPAECRSQVYSEISCLESECDQSLYTQIRFGKQKEEQTEVRLQFLGASLPLDDIKDRAQSESSEQGKGGEIVSSANCKERQTP